MGTTSNDIIEKIFYIGPVLILTSCAHHRDVHPSLDGGFGPRKSVYSEILKPMAHFSRRCDYFKTSFIRKLLNPDADMPILVGVTHFDTFLIAQPH